MKAALVELREPPDALLARAESLHVEDKKAERLSKRWGIIAVVSIVLLAFTGPFLAGLGPIAWGGMIGLFVFALVQWRRYRSHDLDDRKVATLAQVVRILRADVPAATPMHAQVDFREYRKGGRQVTCDEVAGSKTFHFTHPWFRLRAVLADGTAAGLEVTDDVKRKEKRKRKYTKVTEQVRSRVLVTVRFDKRYVDITGVAERLQSSAPPPGLEVARVTARGRTVVASFRGGRGIRRSGGRGTPVDAMGDVANGDTLLLALRWVYDGVAPLARSA
jgi:hypothetical protein